MTTWRDYTVGMLVRIKDLDMCGIWRGQTGLITKIKGGLITIKTPTGTTQATSELIEPSPQMDLFNS
jgi:hypothetical protein